MVVSRRDFLVAATTAAAAAARAFAQWQPSQRYPDSLVRSVDPGFERYRLSLAKVERLATGHRWCEGPVWFGDGRYLLWSDIPNDRIMRWDEETGAVSLYRKPSNFSNGNTRDRQGRLLTCEHGARRVTRTEYDGTISVIADRFDGKPLNSPNDVVCKSDGSIWFSDPPFGILGFYEGHLATPELPTNVYRVDGKTGRITVAAEGINRPNGLAFSPDETRLYIVEAGALPRLLHVYDVVDNGTRLANKRKFLDAGAGTPDGFRCDIDGNLWCGWGMGQEGFDGVSVFNPEGRLIGRIDLPERCANLCFGGTHRNRLFMAASSSIYSLFVNSQGAAGG
jgi:gluconolactonase